MKILMFGRGVIATQYAWAFEKAGNQVEFYVRPGRITKYGPFINLDLIDGRKNSKGDKVIEKWNIKMKENIDSGDNYDLIIISVNPNQLYEAAETVSTWNKNSTILFFNNIWTDLERLTNYFSKDQVLFGFPGAGGGYKDNNSLEGGFMKTVYLQSEDTAPSKSRYSDVLNLFENSGFSVSQQSDIRSWLWTHFIVNAALLAQCEKAGGYYKLFESSSDVEQMLKLIREMLPLIKAKGGKPDIGTTLLLHFPVKLAAFVMKKLLTGGGLAGKIASLIETTGHSTKEANSIYPKEVLLEGRKLNISLPMLSALEPYFS